MKPIRLPGKPDIRHADLLCMCKSITQSMCMQCTSTAFHNPGPTAHMLFLAIAQISAPHFPVLVLKFTLKYPGNFLSCSNFVWTEKKFPSIYACFLYKPGYRISASTMCLGTGVYDIRGRKVSVAWKCHSLPSNTGNMVVLKASVTLELSSPAHTASRSSSTIQNHFPQNDRRVVTAIRGIIDVISAPH